MAHAVARTPPLVLCLVPYDDVSTVLECCKGMNSRMHCCVVVPAPADADNDLLPELVPEPEPAVQCGNLAVVRIPCDLYDKFARNASERGILEYHCMIHDDSYPSELSNGHFPLSLFSTTQRAQNDAKMQKELAASFDFETGWYCPETGMQDAGELAAELDGENKEDKYRAREQYFCDLWHFGTTNLNKMSMHELCTQVHGLPQLPNIITLKANTVGPWTLYDALYRHVESCAPSGIEIPSWEVFEEVCASQRPERPAKRRRLAGGAAGGSA
jgi:hypothetical protein